MKFNLDILREELVGNHTQLQTPYGHRLLTYADYTASGRSVSFIEKHLFQVQAYYANSHTEDSYTGKVMTTLIHEAEKKLKQLMNANEDYIIPVGTGSTGAIQKLAEILGIYQPPGLARFSTIDDLNKVPVVFIGPYEHHSNDLIWRESIADVVSISLATDGSIDLEDLKAKLVLPQYKGRLKIGSFSAASNVTGIITPVYEVAEILHKNGAYACFDFAASGPYVEIDMNHDENTWFDAVYISPHKFLGGPGACGLLLINRRLYHSELSPTVAGGGTVDYVSPFAYDFTSDVEAREMAGTPGILQILKAQLAFELKDAIGLETIETLEKHYTAYAFKRLLQNKNIDILGPKDPERRISILSFNIRYSNGYLHHRLITRLLNDLFGIQSRAGCACAGPYGHRLLNIDDNTSEIFRNFIQQGVHSLKPGWVRVNFHYALTQEQVAFICDAIEFIAEKGYLFLSEYALDAHSGAWNYRDPSAETAVPDFNIEAAYQQRHTPWIEGEKDSQMPYSKYFQHAAQLAASLETQFDEFFATYPEHFMDEHRWFSVKNLIL